MIEKISKPMTFFETVKEIAFFYIHVFKHIIVLVALAALVQAIISVFMPENPTVGLALSILASVVAMFFYAWILAHADSVYLQRDNTVRDSLQVAKKRFINLMGVLFFYILIILILGLFGFGMQLLGKVLNIQIVTAVITFCLFIFVFTLLAFTMPAVILEKLPIIQSFVYSARLVWGHWWRTFGIFLLFAIPVVILSLGVFLLPTRNIYAITLYEFIYHLITYPLMISVILIMYHDLSTRHHQEGFKHVAELEDREKS